MKLNFIAKFLFKFRKFTAFSRCLKSIKFEFFNAAFESSGGSGVDRRAVEDVGYFEINFQLTFWIGLASSSYRLMCLFVSNVLGDRTTTLRFSFTVTQRRVIDTLHWNKCHETQKKHSLFNEVAMTKEGVWSCSSRRSEATTAYDRRHSKSGFVHRRVVKSSANAAAAAAAAIKKALR